MKIEPSQTASDSINVHSRDPDLDPGQAKGKKLKRMQRDFLKEKSLNASAKPGLHDLIVVLDHLKPDFNIGKIFRSGDAMGIREIHLVGVQYFHPASAMGSFRHVPAKFFKKFDDCFQQLTIEEYDIYTFEPKGGEILFKTQFKPKSAFVLGHEEFGLSFEKNKFPSLKSVTVPQFGKVQSLNVSVAASIAMYEYISQCHHTL